MSEALWRIRHKASYADPHRHARLVWVGLVVGEVSPASWAFGTERTVGQEGRGSSPVAGSGRVGRLAVVRCGLVPVPSSPGRRACRSGHRGEGPRGLFWGIGCAARGVTCGFVSRTGVRDRRLGCRRGSGVDRRQRSRLIRAMSSRLIWRAAASS